MSAYRFCRTDDIALLVDAWNRCGLPHELGGVPLSVPAFKQEIRELGLWCSSCMVAFDGSDPVAVLIGCKRPPETLVLRIAAHPDHLRRGHGRHLLTSLSAKLAILGPKTLLAEIPEENAAARALFAACGWREERRWVDLVPDPAALAIAPRGVVQEVTPDELGTALAPSPGAHRSWGRTQATTTARGDRLKGLAIASDERLEAALLYATDDARVTVWSLAYERDAAGEAALRSLLRELVHRDLGSISIPRIGGGEIDLERLPALGLHPGPETIGCASEARSA